MKNITTKISNEKANESFWLKTKKWLKNNPVELWVVALLSTSLIYGFAFAMHDVSFKELFRRMNIMHTSFSNQPIATFGFGVSLFNASCIGFLFYIWAKITRVKWTGVAFMSIVITYGFSFYIHNFYGLMFLMLGILLSSVYRKQSLDKYFGAFTLSASTVPFFALLAFGSGSNLPMYGGVLMGGTLMIFVGIIAQSVGALIGKVNDGLTLANTGVSHGFLAIFMYAVMLAFGMFSSTAKDNDAVYKLVHGASVIVPDLKTIVTWHFIPYISGLSTILLAFGWLSWQSERGIKDIFIRDGKAPTDYFVLSGKRETYFSIWLIIHFMIFLEGIWTWQTGKSFGFTSDNQVAFIQAISFAPWGGHITGAILLTIGFYIAYYGTLAGVGGFTENGGWAANDTKANGPWGPYSFSSLVFFGWLLTPLVTINWVAPILGGILHASIHRMFGPVHGNLFMFNHGLSTFMSVFILQGFFHAMNWLRKHRDETWRSKSHLQHDKNESERSKATAMTSELLYYLLDHGSSDVSTKYKFNPTNTIIEVAMEHTDKEVLDKLADQMNKVSRDPLTEFNLWTTLGTDPSTRNIPLLASLVDHAIVTIEGEKSILTISRERSSVKK